MNAPVFTGWDLGSVDTTVRCNVRVVLPAGFLIVGPTYRTEVHGDGTVIHKIDHRNGVSDVVVERPDGSRVESIEVK